MLSCSLIFLSFKSCTPHSLFVAAGCGQRQQKSDTSDLGLVLQAQEESHVSQPFVPPHQSRLAVEQQAREILECRSAEMVIEEVELDILAQNKVSGREGVG